jgi:hypothetical protein
MVATFTVYSPNTYDRGPILISPTSFSDSSWANRVCSPSIDAFKLADPPTSKRASRKTEGSLTTPILKDPRSPRPRVSDATVRFEKLSSQMPRGNRGKDDLGKALSSYPRSPYPSAPVSPAFESEEDFLEVESRGRSSRRPRQNSGVGERVPLLARTRSLEVETKRRNSLHSASPAAKQSLTPVQESPRVTITRPPPLNLTGNASTPGRSTRLSHAFWDSVSLEPQQMLSPSVVMPETVTSHTPPLLFGGKDGTLWSPGLPKNKRADTRLTQSLLSPTPKPRLRKSVVASPSPNDPFAAFPSFTIALSGASVTIAYPPRALMEQD